MGGCLASVGALGPPLQAPHHIITIAANISGPSRRFISFASIGETLLRSTNGRGLTRDGRRFAPQRTVAANRLLLAAPKGEA